MNTPKAGASLYQPTAGLCCGFYIGGAMMAGMERRIWAGGRWLRYGYTSGACAAGAAKAAAKLLLTGKKQAGVTISLADGSPLTLAIWEQWQEEQTAHCGIRKDSGDDPDITDGMLVYAKVRQQEEGISIDGGQGVGRVTKPGLDQPVGAAAINSGPRRMIEQELWQLISELGYEGGLAVEIYIPEGEALAKRTFNGRLGIVGGLSILGSTGLLQPMSEEALLDSIKTELAVLAAAGRRDILLTPGNYGEEFCREHLRLSLNQHIKCSNFIADTIEAALGLGFQHILLVGHIGKLIKLGLGARNTHSAHGDGRMPLLLMYALQAGASRDILWRLTECVSSEAALLLLQEQGLLEVAMTLLGRDIEASLQKWAGPEKSCGFISFSRQKELPQPLCSSDNAPELLKIWREE